MTNQKEQLLGGFIIDEQAIHIILNRVKDDNFVFDIYSTNKKLECCEYIIRNVESCSYPGVMATLIYKNVYAYFGNSGIGYPYRTLYSTYLIWLLKTRKIINYHVDIYGFIKLRFDGNVDYKLTSFKIDKLNLSSI